MGRGYQALRQFYHRWVRGPLCHLWGELPDTGERVDPRGASALVEGHRAVYLWARGLVPGPGRVLDLCCGAGYGATLLGAQEYLGVDRDRAAIEFATRTYGGPGVRYLRRDARQLGPDLGCFDLVVASNALEHIPEAVELLPTLRGLVAPGGALVVCVPPALEDGEDDGNEWHVSVLTARTWAAALGSLFDAVEGYAHRGWEEPAEAQRFEPAAPEDLVPGETISANLVARVAPR